MTLHQTSVTPKLYGLWRVTAELAKRDPGGGKWVEATCQHCGAIKHLGLYRLKKSPPKHCHQCGATDNVTVKPAQFVADCYMFYCHEKKSYYIGQNLATPQLSARALPTDDLLNLLNWPTISVCRMYKGTIALVCEGSTQDFLEETLEPVEIKPQTNPNNLPPKELPTSQDLPTPEFALHLNEDGGTCYLPKEAAAGFKDIGLEFVPNKDSTTLLSHLEQHGGLDCFQIEVKTYPPNPAFCRLTFSKIIVQPWQEVPDFD